MGGELQKIKNPMFFNQQIFFQAHLLRHPRLVLFSPLVTIRWTDEAEAALLESNYAKE
jgi:hypothetical protein